MEAEAEAKMETPSLWRRQWIGRPWTHLRDSEETMVKGHDEKVRTVCGLRWGGGLAKDNPFARMKHLGNTYGTEFILGSVSLDHPPIILINSLLITKI